MVNNMKKLFILCLALLFLLPPMTSHAADFEGETYSSSIAVYNTALDIFVYLENADEKITPAPAKLMTALIALEYYEGRMQKTATVTSAALKNLEGSSVLNLKAGEVIAVEHLIHAVLVAGMSDAANALAIDIAGTLSAFVKLMNEKAKELGTENTVFTSANGLETQGSFSTAKDTALIAAAAYQNAELRKIAAKRYYIVPATNLHDSVTIYTKNMIVSPQSEYYDKNVSGLCATYSESSEHSVIAAAESNFPYVCVALQCEKLNGKIGAYSDVSRLLSWATGNFAELKILDSAKIIAEIAVSGGKDTDHVLIIPDSAVYAFLDVDTDLSKITLSPMYTEKLKAPVEKGALVGEVLILLDGEPIGTANLITKNAVKQSSSTKFWLSVGKALPTIAVLIIILAFFIFIRKAIINRSKR